MKRFSLFITALFLAAVCGAFAQDVRYNFDKDTDFSKFKTYRWVVLKNAGKVDDILDKDIKRAIDQELAAKGLTKVEDDKADLYVGYQTAIGKEKEFTAYSTGWGYGGGWYHGGWYGPSGGMTTGQTSTIYTGQLVLDMYQVTNQSLVWRGVVSKSLDPKAKPDKQQKNLAKAMAKLMKNYPPVAKKQ